MIPKLARIERIDEFDESAWYGIILSQTESLLCLHYVSDRYDLDGYRCFRKRDISNISYEFERRDFIERALRCKGLQYELPDIELVDDIGKMMQLISDRNQLVVIHREIKKPDACEIGKICVIAENTYQLDWISPNGEWELDNREFLFNDVTRLDWCDEYSNTLLMVEEDRNGI